MELQTMPLRFRVWDKAMNEWAKPSIIFNEIKWAMQNDVLNFCSHDNDLIISQDTGLKDKNGKSIYTGDIVKVFGSFSTPQVFVVSYSIECGHARIFPFYPKADDDLIPGTDESELIGNIWQNPELLEEMGWKI